MSPYTSTTSGWRLLAFLSASCWFMTMSTAYHWPSPKFDAIEALLYEASTEPPESVPLPALLEECNYQPGDENAAADWVRLVYHDAATHNIDDGTGGLDASIYYELDRPEVQNVGFGMKKTQFDFIDFPNKYISKSDVIGIGLVMAIAECGGPTIPFRMGRVDAAEAGPPGVPEPHGDLAAHTESFRRQGFTPTEMIGLVACGHSLGGVRFPDFPDIVSSPDGGQVVNNFDTTFAMDNAVVTEYLDGTTKNPLVVHNNKTILSDLRIFGSDNNATMRSMASAEAFAQTCQTLLERMINTVPMGVELSEIIKPLAVKVAGVQLSVASETLRLKSMLRLSTQNINRQVTIHWENRNGEPCPRSICSAPFINSNITETTLFKRNGMNPRKYWFDTPVDATTSISKFWFEVDEKDGSIPVIHDNEGTGYVIEQDMVLWDPKRSQGDILGFNIVVAVRNNKTPSRVYANVKWRVSFFPKDETVDFVPAPEIEPTAGYIFYKAAIAGPDFMFDLFSEVDGVTYSEDARDTLFIKPEHLLGRRALEEKREARANLRRGFK